MRAEPLGVRGAFGFGLKEIGQALLAAGQIETSWGGGVAAGLEAMSAAFWCEAQAAQRGTTLSAFPQLQEIEAYNEIDCKVMAEVHWFLRERC